MEILKSGERGHGSRSWLDSRHSFSFGGYYNQLWMGRGPLRVINEDRIAPGGGFPTHGHSDMEILTFVIDGALEHRDSLGTGSVVHPGEVQRMSAGSGIEHSEFNASKTDPLHLLQIWILPERKGLHPGYEQKQFSGRRAQGRLTLLASPDGAADSLTLHQQGWMHVLDLGSGNRLRLADLPGRQRWLQMVKGANTLQDRLLEQGDGAWLEDAPPLEVTAQQDSVMLVFSFA